MRSISQPPMGFILVTLVVLVEVERLFSALSLRDSE
jgi:hypothetical protein